MNLLVIPKFARGDGSNSLQHPPSELGIKLRPHFPEPFRRLRGNLVRGQRLGDNTRRVVEYLVVPTKLLRSHIIRLPESLEGRISMARVLRQLVNEELKLVYTEVV